MSFADIHRYFSCWKSRPDRLTSVKQIAANRRNASKSTGQRTEEGKHRSRRNAVSHGLAAETVIGALEDAEDCRVFAYYDQTRVGAEAEISPEKPIGGRYVATVTVIDQVFDAASGAFGVRLALPNPDNKLPGGINCKIRFGAR